ncbi:unnamed protein product [[Candida] boidinii]|uniref:Unnamed protein product n=1 Tax=Candida boidinii TaxID=5477 RepID=A0A9W6T470_CANBO|nr:unnamed protein product [[Candida] boidinii]GMG11022.1 unnamed protein product [[Candida] boidinii]
MLPYDLKTVAQMAGVRILSSKITSAPEIRLSSKVRLSSKITSAPKIRLSSKVRWSSKVRRSSEARKSSKVRSLLRSVALPRSYEKVNY